MKRFLAIVLAALLLLAVLSAAGCGKNGQPASTTQSSASPDRTEGTPEETAIVYPNQVKTFDGETFRIFMRSAQYYDSLYIYVEQDEGDIMSSRTFARNARLEKDCDIKLEARTDERPDKKLQGDIESGDLDYDVILTRTADLTSKAADGLLTDYRDLDIDYQNIWWDKNCLDGYSIEGKTFLMANDISVSRINNAYFFYFNRGIVEDFKLRSPYDFVAKNEWTLDNFLELVKSVSDVKENDLGIYGWETGSGEANGAHMHLMGGSGISYTALNADGTRTLAVGDQLDKIETVFNKIRTVINDPNYCMDTTKAFDVKPVETDKNRNSRTLFANGHFLFLQGGMIISQELIDMAQGYGVVPNPKFDKNQDRYYHKIDKFSIIFAIPNAASYIDREKVAAVMDYWAFLSHDTVMSAYYDITIKARRISDAIAPQMIDIVRDTILYEAADVFSVGVSAALNSGYEGGNLASSWKDSERSVNTKLNDIFVKIAALD